MAQKIFVANTALPATDLNNNFNLLFDNNVTLTYNADGTVNTVTNNDQTVTYTLTWTNGRLVSFTDGTNTWTASYDTNTGNFTGLVKT